MEIPAMTLSIISIIVGSFVTWLVAKWYYDRSKDDFSILISKLDRIAEHQKSEDKHITQDSNNIKINNIFNDTDSMGEAILSYARNSGAEMGAAERGIPIYALDELIDRINRIKESLQSYRNWRVHLGA